MPVTFTLEWTGLTAEDKTRIRGIGKYAEIDEHADDGVTMPSLHGNMRSCERYYLITPRVRMSERIICHGCGQRFEVPENYRRNKIQCPECGVITPVNLTGGKLVPSEDDKHTTESAFETKAAPSQATIVPSKPESESEPDLAALPDPPASYIPEESQDESTVWTCSHCGEWQPRRPRGKKARCPVCKTAVPDIAKKHTTAVKPALLKDRKPRPAVHQDEWSEDDDGKPYKVDAQEYPPCPNCSKPMAPEAVVCVNCGLDLREGKKAKTVYDPISRAWDAGLSRHYRWLGFVAWQCFAVPPMLWGASHEGHAFYVIGGWLWLSLMAAFLLGTYDRIDLNRNSRGKVRLLKTWSLCFYRFEPSTVDLAQYESILTGQVHDLDFSDYVVLSAAFGFGIIPAIIWYFTVMQRDTFYVALTRDHGHPEMMIYRGWNEARMKEIANTLRTAALPEYPWY